MKWYPGWWTDWLKENESVIYTCGCCHATTNKRIWARAFGGRWICPKCERYFDTLDNPIELLSEVFVGDNPHTRPHEFEEMLEDSAYQDRFVSGGEVGR